MRRLVTADAARAYPPYGLLELSSLRDRAIRLPNVVEGVHRGGPSLSVGGKTFTLWWAEGGRTIMKLAAAHQQLLFEVLPDVFQPCRVGVGTWSFIDLSQVEESELLELVIDAWGTVVPRRVSNAFDTSALVRLMAPPAGADA